MLTTAEIAALRTAIFAETDPAVVEARAGATRHDAFIDTWLNGASTSDAWRNDLSAKALVEETNINKFDTLTAGKRDAWRLILEYSPIDFTRQKNRNAVVDVWGAADSVALLTACTRKATRAENILGGTSVTTNTITALRLNWMGTVSREEVGRILNG